MYVNVYKGRLWRRCKTIFDNDFCFALHVPCKNWLTALKNAAAIVPKMEEKIYLTALQGLRRQKDSYTFYCSGCTWAAFLVQDKNKDGYLLTIVKKEEEENDQHR